MTRPFDWIGKTARTCSGAGAFALGLVLLASLAASPAASSAGRGRQQAPSQASARPRSSRALATTLTIDASPAVVEFDGATQLSGSLIADGGLLADRDVTLWRSTEPTVTWSQVATAAWDPADGAYESSATCQASSWFQYRFAGDATYAETSATPVLVQSRALVTTPTVPATIQRNVFFTIAGSIRPRHETTVGTRLYLYQYYGGAYQLRRTPAAPMSPESTTSSRYAARYRLLSPGRWQVAAAHADADHETSWSGRRSFVVFDLFQSSQAMRHVLNLGRGIGVRRAGWAGERRAASYIARKLASYGYMVSTQRFRLPGGRRSQNLIVRQPGFSSARIVLGAHYDSVRGSPGANDNGSGAGVLLELARVLKGRRTQATIEFVFFGAEEVVGNNPNVHHVGSHTFVARMSRTRRAKIAGMISVDMVGYGGRFYRRTMGSGPQSLSRMIYLYARRRGTRLAYLKDRGSTGWSDHAPFEFAGIPAVWLEWRTDPTWHSRSDTPAHVRSRRIGQTGALLHGFLTRLPAAHVRALLRANRS